ncbi:WD40-repeat-containing domain protein [Lentinula raphanica]|nr:WD40-repeat-containing domain protein [Lentinula raphanica]
MDIYFQKRRNLPLPFSQPLDSVVASSFSFDGRYLAIGYGNGVDVWELDSESDTPVLTTHRRTKKDMVQCLAWFAHQHRLILGHRGGHVYTIDDKDTRFSTAGIRPENFHEDATSIAVLDEQIFAVAFTKSVMIYEARSQEFKDDLEVLGSLQSPPAIEGLDVANVQVSGIHMLPARRLLVSYGNVAAVEWQITLNPFRASVLRLFDIPGAICGTSPCGNKFLIANNTGAAYELHSFSSRRSPQLFVPRRYKEAQPITTASFLSDGIIVGGSVGQLVIWDDEARRLQHIDFLDHQSSPINIFECVYRPELDVALIASVVDGREVILWEWNGNSTRDTRDGCPASICAAQTQRGIATGRISWLKIGLFFLVAIVSVAVIMRFSGRGARVSEFYHAHVGVTEHHHVGVSYSPSKMPDYLEAPQGFTFAKKIVLKKDYSEQNHYEGVIPGFNPLLLNHPHGHTLTGKVPNAIALDEERQRRSSRLFSFTIVVRAALVIFTAAVAVDAIQAMVGESRNIRFQSRQCAEKYEINHCNNPAPAIEGLCMTWRLCKDRPFIDVGYSTVIAQAVARCFNGFFDAVSVSTMIGFFCVSFTFVVWFVIREWRK